jgi:replication initiation protein RepC
MESGHVTTPFGRRAMTLGMLASQVAARDIEAEKSVDKWKLYRALCEARPLLGITDRALAVLNALLSFYPRNELAEEHGLIVFPSNAQLSLRAHGMAEQTIRRHLSVLIEAGLLIRKDSPNGKRYAHKDRSGEINDAFGFSLAPLLARAEEIERLAAEVIAERLHLQRLRERLTLCRRDITKLVEAALEDGAGGDWMGIVSHLHALLDDLPRKPTVTQIEATLDEMELLREEVINRLEMLMKTQKQSGNPYQNERHIQNSNPEIITESEPSFETKQGAKSEIAIGREIKPQGRHEDEADLLGKRSEAGEHAGLKSFPLGLVLQACPQISDYGSGGTIGNWRDLMSAAVVVRSMLGVSPSAYQDACSVMGPENAATVMACILERGGHISSAGGYLRDLTRRAEKGEFALGPMLMALLRANGSAAKRVS